MRLVGVEFIVDAAAWMAHHDAPPMLEGQAFQLVGSPNRYGLPAFFELHVWAWRENPNGAFVDWNTRVTAAKVSRWMQGARQRGYNLPGRWHGAARSQGPRARRTG